MLAQGFSNETLQVSARLTSQNVGLFMSFLKTAKASFHCDGDTSTVSSIAWMRPRSKVTRVSLWGRVRQSSGTLNNVLPIFSSTSSSSDFLNLSRTIPVILSTT